MNGATAQSPMKDYVPPKDWEKITSDEKIERLREVIKGLQQQVSQSQVAVHTLRQKLVKHEHKDGKVYEMKEIQAYDDSMGLGLVGTATGLSNSKYF